MNLLALVLATVVTATPAPREWRDGIRDVYIDGKLERNAQTLSTTAPRMVAVVCGEEVLLLDPEKQSVALAAKAAFAFAPDRTKATSGELPQESAGTLVQTGSTYLASVGGKTVLVAPHQSKAGSMTIDELWQTAPVWRAIADHYQPDGALVERLRKIDEPVTLEVVLATWCGDSRQYVPRLLKSIATAGNPNIAVELIGIDADFVKPMDVIAGRNITNVPTVIVKNDGRELGRMVETPASTSVEEDICDIVSGTLEPHKGRMGRGALISTGTYVLRDAQKRAVGTEVFELYERAAGGNVAHSVISRRDGSTIETWASPVYVEVTTRAAKMTRTRYYREGDNWTAVQRGANGILEQVAAAPAAFVSPATVTYAWARDANDVFAIPEHGLGAIAPLAARVDRGTIPKLVKLADGSTRTLIANAPATR